MYCNADTSCASSVELYDLAGEPSLLDEVPASRGEVKFVVSFIGGMTFESMELKSGSYTAKLCDDITNQRYPSTPTKQAPAIVLPCSF